MPERASSPRTSARCPPQCGSDPACARGGDRPRGRRRTQHRLRASARLHQVTLNGMECQPTAPRQLRRHHRGRAFDFNVFPAELSPHRHHKSSLPSIEEGGVAARCDVHRGRADSATGARRSWSNRYNDLSKETDPRFTATYSTANQAKTVAHDLRGAGSRNSCRTVSHVRWEKPDANFRGNETR